MGLVSRRHVSVRRWTADVDDRFRPRNTLHVGRRATRISARVRGSSPVRDRARRARGRSRGPPLHVHRRRGAGRSRRRRAGGGHFPATRIRDGGRPLGNRSDVRARVIYDDLRVVDTTTGIAGAYCAKLLTDLGADVRFATRVDDPLFTYLRTSQQHTTDVAQCVAAADIVLLGETAVSTPNLGPLVTVSITALGRGGPDDGVDLPEEVLQARSGSLAAHGHMHLPPLTVGGHLGEYIAGAFAALGAATAWSRASRTGVAERVDASMLEAIQLTYVTVPTLMARFPGGRAQSFRWVMIPGNEPAGDGRYVGITTVTAQQWQALARLIGRPDQADDDELGTMIGRFRRADEVNGAIHAYTRRHAADDVVAACVEARVPAAIVGNGAELPRNEQLAARGVFVRQPGESWIRPRAPFRFHGVPDRELRAPGVAHKPWKS